MRFTLPIELGIDFETRRPVILPLESFSMHYSLIGATGSGKSVAASTITQELMTNGSDRSAFFVIDPLGGFARNLLRFIADDRYCPDSVRRRLIYFEPANTGYTTTIQPLQYHSRPNQDFQVARTLDLIMRGFDDQDLMNMPRLRRFLYQAVFDISQLGLPLALTRYLLQPNTEEHAALVSQLPNDSQAVWLDVMRSQGNKALDYLDSTRNRVSLFSDFVILQRLYSSTDNLLDIPRWMEEGRIVIINLSPGDQDVHWQVADTIGSMVINEVCNHSLSLYHRNKAPTDTFLVIDEFQRFLGPDIYNFLPIIRNLGLKLILANQSYAQLEQGDVDLRPLMGQARSRLMFANDYEDADIMAEEIASLEWDPNEIKHQVQTYRQRLVDHQTIILRGGGNQRSVTKTNTRQSKRGTSAGESYAPGEYHKFTRSEGTQRSWADVTGGSIADAESENWREQLVPIYEDFYETSGVQFVPREDVVHKWSRRLRRLGKGRCLGKLVEDPTIYHIDVDYLPNRNDPRVTEAVEQLLEQNYSGGPFITAEQADRNLEQVRAALLTGPVIRLHSHKSSATPQEDQQRDLFGH